MPDIRRHVIKKIGLYLLLHVVVVYAKVKELNIEYFVTIGTLVKRKNGVC